MGYVRQTVVPRSHKLVLRCIADGDSELLERMTAQQFYTDEGRLEGLEDEVEVLAQAGDVLYYHPYLVHGASKNRRDEPRKVLFTHYYPALGPEQEAQRQRQCTWLTDAEVGERFHWEVLAAREGDADFERLVGAEGWAP